MIRFSSLRGRLTVLYAGLFGVALLATAVAVTLSVGGNARHQVEKELAAGGAVFDRLWAMKASQLADGARVLSRDFGFREAFASGDAPTVESALTNLKDRLALDRAFIIAADGTLTGAPDIGEAAATDLWHALDSGALSGVLRISETPYQAVAEPIMAPQLVGWVVFAERLDRKEMASLESLASIPLSAAVLTRQQGAPWLSTDAGRAAEPRLARFVDVRATGPRPLATDNGEAVALARPLTVIGEKADAVLVLRYPLNLAMAPYHSLLVTLVFVGFLGLCLLVAGSWLLARSITRPISALDEAARRLRDGEDAHVEVDTGDELGRLADSFNAMAGGIREREQRITALALTDQETALPNRRALEAAIAQADPAGLYIAAIGVDRFPQVRAAVGYRLAGEMLRQLALRLGDLRPGDLCARLSSERLALMFRAGSPAMALGQLESLVEALSRPVRVDGQTIDVGLNAGLAAVAQAHLAPPAERASIALDQARKSRRAAVAFDAETYGDPASKLSLMSEMLAALANGEISMAYQPKHDTRAGVVTGVEALVRWNHPIRGFVSPDMFVGLAEETGHIRALTVWTLDQALRDQAALRLSGHDLLVSVNLSGRMLADPEFATLAIDRIAGAGGRICLEITETAVIDHPETAHDIIDRFRAAGIKISIDDYGSGLSSLAYLKQIRADELKIDKEFILTLDRSARDALLVKSTVDLAHSLGLQTVAEGVETAESLAILTAMGCDLAQGYFIARPMPLANVVDFLDEARAPAAPKSRKA
ncbi:MAG: EAL domain-containing protein [Caulobacteraceae bacterium]|nr:MAG: EAL domain-containing protein [Caulobacteraceae bacterium]